tara:strand:- start:1421 stop:1753 length:333 start_codon:yes stop_codon:yes gene_type:complete
MGTHCDVYFETEKDGFIGTYCHYDGYPEHMIPQLTSMDYAEVAATVLIAIPKGGLRCLSREDGTEYLESGGVELLTNPNEDWVSQFVYIKRLNGQVQYRLNEEKEWKTAS